MIFFKLKNFFSRLVTRIFTIENYLLYTKKDKAYINIVSLGAVIDSILYI